MVEFFLSGSVEARIDGSFAPLGGPKQRCILAVLLAAPGTVVSLDRLIDSVWEDRAPAKALTSVRSYLANLRKVLDPDPGATGTRAPRLESRMSGYRINLAEDDWIDLREFETLVDTGLGVLDQGRPAAAFDQLTRALDLWRGDPFGEFTNHAFAHSESVRYAELRNTAVEARFDAALRTGDGRDLIPEIEAAIARDPLQERLWAHLILALYRTGHPARAMHAYERVCAVLAAELGTTPGPPLARLHQQVSDGSPELLLAAVPTPHDSIAVTGVHLVGRESETAALARSVSGARAGRGGLVLVTGEPGIGKSALAQAVCEEPHSAEMAVARAAHPSGIRLPLMWTWIQVLRELGRELGEPGRDLVRRTVPGIVDALVPEWNDPRDRMLIRSPASGFELIEGVAATLCELASLKPLLLVLDDLHIADADACEVLAFLTDHLPHRPIQIVGNWTTDSRGRPLNRESFDRLVRSSGVQAHQLGGLADDAAADLIQILTSATASAPVVDHVITRAAGSPFYIKELVRTITAANLSSSATEIDADGNVSQAVASLVGRRLARLDGQCRHLLEWAAVTGPEFDATTLADVVHRPTSSVHALLQPAYEDGLIDEIPSRPGAYRFSHGLLRDAALALIRPSDRASIHAAIATSQSAVIEIAAYEEAVATADHAWRAGSELDADLGLDILDTVIGRGLARSAYADVTVHTSHALDICRRMPPKPEALERQAKLWLNLAGMRSILHGQSSGLVNEALQRAFEIGEKAGGRNFHATVALQSMTLCGLGRIDEAQALSRGLNKEYLASRDPDVGVAAHFVDVMIHGLRGDLDAQDATARRLLALFPPPDEVVDPLRFFHPRVHCWIAIGQALRGDRDTAHEHCRIALDLAQVRGDLFNVLAAKLGMVEIDAILGIVDGTGAAADSVHAEMSAAGAHQWAACAAMVSVWARTLAGEEVDPDRATEAFGTYTSDGSSVMTPFFLALLADIERHHGRSQNAHDLLIRARTVGRTSGERVWEDQLALRLAELADTAQP